MLNGVIICVMTANRRLWRCYTPEGVVIWRCKCDATKSIQRKHFIQLLISGLGIIGLLASVSDPVD
jgi:hypothetical protein